MQINNINANNVNFSSYMRAPHIAFIKAVNPHNAERTLERRFGVASDFDGNNIVAGLALYTTRVFKALNLPLPPQLIVHVFHKKDKCLLYVRSAKAKTYGRKKVKRFAVNFSKKALAISSQRYDRMSSNHSKVHGTGHFLNIPIHEFLHSIIFQKIGRIAARRHEDPNILINKLSKISIEPFKAEINSKIGTYASADVFELHAVYWAREICKCLNDSLLPKYNPFKEPQIKLSRDLRIFINKISRCDVAGAKKFSEKVSAKLQRSNQSR